ncbi:Unknown protein sequence, partial [Pseudomonas syringae pv. papulans]
CISQAGGAGGTGHCGAESFDAQPVTAISNSKLQSVDLSASKIQFLGMVGVELVPRCELLAADACGFAQAIALGYCAVALLDDGFIPIKRPIDGKPDDEANKQGAK